MQTFTTEQVLFFIREAYKSGYENQSVSRADFEDRVADYMDAVQAGFKLAEAASTSKTHKPLTFHAPENSEPDLHGSAIHRMISHFAKEDE